MDKIRFPSIARMANQARAYLADAASLEQIRHPESDGAYLLQLIAFEIALKAVLRANDKTPGRNHKYSALFQELPSETQGRLLAAAAGRFGPEADFANHIGLLDTWGSNFVGLRYAYESYEGVSDKEVTERGEAWLAAGANVEEADFKYYPFELRAFTEALLTELESSSR